MGLKQPMDYLNKAIADNGPRLLFVQTPWQRTPSCEKLSGMVCLRPQGLVMSKLILYYESPLNLVSPICVAYKFLQLPLGQTN